MPPLTRGIIESNGSAQPGADRSGGTSTVTSGGTEASVGRDGQVVLSKTEAPPTRTAPEPTLSRQAVDRFDVKLGADGQVSLTERPLALNEVEGGLMLMEVRQQSGQLRLGIADANAGKVAEYRAVLADGKPLPDWIRIDGSTGRVTCVPPAGTQAIALRVVAVDQDGSTRTLVINLDLGTDLQDAPTSTAPQTPDPSARLSARPGFTRQLAQAHQAWEGYGTALVKAVENAP